MYPLLPICSIPGYQAERPSGTATNVLLLASTSDSCLGCPLLLLPHPTDETLGFPPIPRLQEATERRKFLDHVREASLLGHQKLSLVDRVLHRSAAAEPHEIRMEPWLPVEPRVQAQR